MFYEVSEEQWRSPDSNGDGFVANFLFQSFSYWDGGLGSGGTGVQG
jgi:hypothetical protein